MNTALVAARVYHAHNILLWAILKMISLCFSAVKYFQYTLVSVSMFPDMFLHVQKWCVKFYSNSLMEKENILKLLAKNVKSVTEKCDNFENPACSNY